MKNTIKVFGIIALVAVIGFSMVACDDGGDKYTDEDKEATTAGRLTITGLSAYNGKKIDASAGSWDNTEYGSLRACQTATNSYSYKNGNLTQTVGKDSVEGTITDGQVTLKVFSITNNGFQSYTGNHQSVRFSVSIENVNGSVTVNFTNGVGSGAFVAD